MIDMSDSIFNSLKFISLVRDVRIELLIRYSLYGNNKEVERVALWLIHAHFTKGTS